MTQARNHSLLWWLISIISLLFAGFLLLIHLGYFPAYHYALDHFSFPFFALTLLFTVWMSYRRARQYHGANYLGPLLCSFMFALLTQFIVFLCAPLVKVANQLTAWELLGLTLFYIVPSLVAYLLIHQLVVTQDLANNDWFDGRFFISWVEMMTNIMTLVTFLELFAPHEATSLIGIRGTIWAFYSLMADYAISYYHQRH